MTTNPTEKQKAYVKRIINYLGKEYVLEYIKHFYPHLTKIEECNRIESQKIITGLSHKLPSPIFSVSWEDADKWIS